METTEFLNSVIADAKGLKRQLAQFAKLKAKLESFGVAKVGKPNGQGDDNGLTVKRGMVVAKARGKTKRGPKTTQQLYGQYMGLVRHLPAEQKAALTVLRETKGVRAAIAEAKRMKAAAATA